MLKISNYNTKSNINFQKRVSVIDLDPDKNVKLQNLTVDKETINDVLSVVSESLGDTSTFYTKDESGNYTPIDPVKGIEADPKLGTDLIIIDDNKKKIPFEEVYLAAFRRQNNKSSDHVIKSMFGDYYCESPCAEYPNLFS